MPYVSLTCARVVAEPVFFALGTSDMACVVCLSTRAKVGCVPCGHLCVCAGCMPPNLRPAGPMRKCPVCRKDVAQLLKVFFAGAVMEKDPPPPPVVDADVAYTTPVVRAGALLAPRKLHRFPWFPLTMIGPFFTPPNRGDLCYEGAM